MKRLKKEYYEDKNPKLANIGKFYYFYGVFFKIIQADMDSTISLRKYLEKRKTFIVPDYQRGYIWGKRKPNTDDLDSVSYILNTIFTKFKNKEAVFLQGMTVTEDRDSITLIDGQQRTTFLYILLKILGYSGVMSIRYDIRNESREFLEQLRDDVDYKENPDEDFQDIYFFKKTARQISERLATEAVGRTEMIEYLLDNIRFLYINIPNNQAKKVFAMMNGNRAKMLESEIIKAELLRLVSQPSDNPHTGDEWELNMLRSRYAREWDRWLHWWNREEVRRMYKTDKHLGWLLMAVMPNSYDSLEKVTFESFCKELFRESRFVKAAKDTFYQMRQTQKRFEDTFNNPKRHNLVGAILRISQNPAKFIKYYFSGNQVNDEELYRYYLCSFIRMSHDMIIDRDGKFDQNFVTRYNDTLENLKKPLLYDDSQGNKELAFQILLRLNIDEDNRQNQGRGRRFDFSIWDDGLRSLEHIYAKSQVSHIDSATGALLNGADNQANSEDITMKREDIGYIDDVYPPIGELNFQPVPLTATEHCIGNLVLLYKDDNSTFNASEFQRKKEIFLVGEEKNGRKEFFKSRHLLHTIYHFAESDWGAQEIRKYFSITLQEFCDSYRIIKDNLKFNSDDAE